MTECTINVRSLNPLTAKGTKWNWDKAVEQVFIKRKEKLATASALGYPDPDKTYLLDMDAYDVGAGAILSQVQEGEKRVIAYYRKTLVPLERNYCVTRKELLPDGEMLLAKPI